MAKQSRGKSMEMYLTRYRASRVWETNRLRKLAKTLKKQPNNEQVKIAMKNVVYRRKTPTTRMWSATWKRTAQLIKQFTGRFDKDIMSSNAAIASAALSNSRKDRPYTLVVNKDKSMYSIFCRANINAHD
jgi:hypothetical protein